MKHVTRLPNSRNEGLIVSELDDETLVYDVDRNEAHCLNHTAALVWKLCDGKTTSTQAARRLQDALGASVDSDFVWLAVRQLQKFHLVERATKSPAVSRRDLVFKYAPAGLALLPVIYTITAPEPAAAASGCAALGDSCTTLPCCPPNNCDGICFAP